MLMLCGRRMLMLRRGGCGMPIPTPSSCSSSLTMQNQNQGAQFLRLPRLLHSRASHGGKAKELKYKALLVDVGGTLLETAAPVEETYADFGFKYGVKISPNDIKKGFRKAFCESWPHRLRYEGDGKPFWRHVVLVATGCGDEAYFEELYQFFGTAKAWKLPPGAYESLTRLKTYGVKLAVVSNFDSRLRPLLQELNISDLFTTIIVSAEVGFEKPAPQIFQVALDRLGVDASDAILLGDDEVADKGGANAIGIESWLWKKEIHSFQELEERILC